MMAVTHRVLAALQKAGLLHGWIQQNHDGLPQKAGFPQVSYTILTCIIGPAFRKTS